MYIAVDIFDSPCGRIAGDEERSSFCESGYRIIKLAQLSRFNLGHGIWGHVDSWVSSVSRLRAVEHKTARAFPAQLDLRVGSGVQSRTWSPAEEICTLTLDMEYPAPSGGPISNI